MRYITADYIFPITSPPIKNGTLIIDEDGKILEIVYTEHRVPDLERYNGILCPGFINAHCHLELSHMKGLINEGAGLTGFISELLQKQKFVNGEIIKKHIENAEKEMIANGIVAVGDISNTQNSFSQKEKGNLFYHTFIELFDLIPEKAKEVYDKGMDFGRNYQSVVSCQWSVVPHAPYSVSNELFQLISEAAIKNDFILSMHNQESENENELFLSKTGKMMELFKSIGISTEHFKKSGKSSLQSCLPLLPKEKKILLVHNIFTDKEDIQFAQYSKNIYWCFCPNANLYIENRLPDFNLFLDKNVTCCIGTDSFASNWNLSILDELKTISKHAPEISLQILLQWATINGAEFFGIKNHFGSFEKNKKPGINLIENVDLEYLKLTKRSSVKKLV